MKRFLCIGGELDGQYVETDLPYWRHIPKVACEFPASVEATTYSFQDYRAESYQSQGRTFDLMLVQGLSLNRAFQMLLENYRPTSRTGG